MAKRTIEVNRLPLRLCRARAPRGLAPPRARRLARETTDSEGHRAEALHQVPFIFPPVAMGGEWYFDCSMGFLDR